MPNRKKKPTYDPNTVMKELVDSVVLAYSDRVTTTASHKASR